MLECIKTRGRDVICLWGGALISCSLGIGQFLDNGLQRVNAARSEVTGRFAEVTANERMEGEGGGGQPHL